MNKSTLFISIVLIMAIFAIGLYIWQNEQDKQTLLSTIDELTAQQAATPEPTAEPMIEKTPIMVSSDSAQMASGSAMANFGTITGSLSFPSEQIPEMMICAEMIGADDEYCTDENIQGENYEYGVGYTLPVPEGDYYVYAKLPNDPYQAYYSDFVTCGLSIDCPSHNPILVEVTAGDTVEDVNPQDWYDNRSADDAS